MIATLGIEGYRAFSSPTTLSLRRLTVIFGKNNSGKTTLTRLPLFIGASLNSAELYSLVAGRLRLGNSFRDLASRHDPHPAVSYWVVREDGQRWRTDLQVVSHALTETVQIRAVDANGLEVDHPISAPGSLFESISGDVSETIESVRASVVRSFDGMLHVPSARPDISPVYEIRAPANYSVAEAPYLLQEKDELLAAVSSWFEVWFNGIQIEVERNDYSFRLTTNSDSVGVNFASSGRGLQALLPLVVLLKAVSLGVINTPLVVLEEPEAHLHPSAHVAIAELVAEASGHAQVLTETHSENFILRLRRKVASEEIPSESLRLLYVDDHAQVSTIDVAADGSVSDWPEGVFAYDVEEARAIVEARLAALGRG